MNRIELSERIEEREANDMQNVFSKNFADGHSQEFYKYYIERGMQ
jgi:hypothetical protein